MEKLLLSVNAAGEMLSIGRNRARELVASGAIASVIVGKRRKVTPQAIHDYIERLEEEAREAQAE